MPTTPTSLQRLPLVLDDDAGGIGRTIDNIRVTTLSGARVSLDDLLRGRRGLVVAMASVECPISRKYAPRIAAIEREFRGRCAFLHVNAVEGEEAAAIRGHLREFAIQGEYARDEDGGVRRALRPRTTTEVFVLDANRRLVYRGAIDDQYRFGGASAEPDRQYLRDALQSLETGRSPQVRCTAAPGCLIDPARSAPEAASDNGGGAVAFYPMVADVLNQHCAGCHFPGGPAPFSLRTHLDVRGRTAMIAAVVREGVMPPNHGERDAGDPGPVLHRKLPDADRERLLAWMDSPLVVGEKPAPDPPAPTTGTWAIGTPDVILFAQGPTVSPGDPATFGRSLVPLDLGSDRWVEAVECRPMKRDSIEVAQVWLLAPGSPLPGPGEFPRGAELFATFSRSDAAVRLEQGAARRLPKDSRLVADILARPMSRPMASQLRIALRLASGPPAREVRTRLVSPERLEIGAGETGAWGEASITLDRGARLIALRPLMGPRGRELAVDLIAPGALPTRLLDLGRYDWRWQIRYPLTRAIDAPAGTRLVLRARFDNSASNPANPDAGVSPAFGVGPGKEYFTVSIEEEVPSDAGAPR